jgi:hypothetical protein
MLWVMAYFLVISIKDLPSSSFPTLIPLSRVGTTCFHHVVIKIRQFFYDRTRLPDVNLPWNWSGCYRLQMKPGPTAMCRSTEELEIINFDHSSGNWLLRTLLRFRNRTPSALTAGLSSSSGRRPVAKSILPILYQNMMKNLFYRPHTAG